MFTKWMKLQGEWLHCDGIGSGCKMVPKCYQNIVKMLSKCQNVFKILLKCCQNFVKMSKILSKYQNIVKISKYCQNVKMLAKYCQNVVKLLSKYCQYVKMLSKCQNIVKIALKWGLQCTYFLSTENNSNSIWFLTEVWISSDKMDTKLF